MPFFPLGSAFSGLPKVADQPANPAHLTENLAAGDLVLDDTTKAVLDGLVG